MVVLQMLSMASHHNEEYQYEEIMKHDLLTEPHKHVTLRGHSMSVLKTEEDLQQAALMVHLRAKHTPGACQKESFC